MTVILEIQQEYIDILARKYCAFLIKENATEDDNQIILDQVMYVIKKHIEDEILTQVRHERFGKFMEKITKELKDNPIQLKF